jgi:hypothetical protein
MKKPLSADPPADAVDAPARKRGRPSVESPREKLARLEREIATVRAAVKEADQRRYTILGEAVAAEAESNPELKATLAEILARRVKSPQAKAEVASLIAA